MKVYLKNFELPSERDEIDFVRDQKMTCYNTVYPFGLFQGRIPKLEFAPVTIFYGGNGSGKTTILNVIAEALGVARDSPFNRSSFFEVYTRCCRHLMNDDEFGLPCQLPHASRFIASDDVFQHILSVRKANSEIDRKREAEFKAHLNGRYEGNWGFDSSRPGDAERLARNVAAKSQTRSQFAIRRAGFNRVEESNGESAIRYFTNAIKEESLYLLDEPENSLSPGRQLELIDFLENSVRGVDDQFIIATHSPLLLSIAGAKIYNLDADPVATADWHQLENPRIYFEFFMRHRELFGE